MSINFGKAWKIVAKIRKHPELHDQDSWTTHRIRKVSADNGDSFDCGTYACFAGWGGFLFAPTGCSIAQGGSILNYRGNSIDHVSDFTRREIGFSAEQAAVIFHQCSDIDEIEVILEALEKNERANGDELRSVLDKYRDEFLASDL